MENAVAVQLPHPWFNIYLYRGVPIAFGLALLFFGRAQFRSVLAEERKTNWRFVGLHMGSLLGFALLQLFLFHVDAGADGPNFRAMVWLWLALFPALVFSLLLAFLPWRRLVSLARALGPAWAYAAVAAALVVWVRERMRLSWGDSSSRAGRWLETASFEGARALLRLFTPRVISEPASHILGTDRFLVIIGGTCSGVEGLALMSALMLVWFIFARRELRIGRALLLVPIALSLVWVLNLVRLVALIAIGDAGYPGVAINGFHSEAGWIVFNLVSLGFLFTAQRTPWFRREEQGLALAGNVAATDATRAHPVRNVPAVYLAPFLAITAMSVIGRAASENFDWLYPLRFFAALGFLWLFRAEYRRMNWRFGVLGPVAGLGVAGMWLVLHSLLAGWSGAGAGNMLADSLGALSPARRGWWIAFRLLAGVLTVPIAEELAFRGFLARRLMSADVDAVPFAELRAWPMLISAVAFGVLHGSMWAPGIIAGLVFALVARSRNRLGEAWIAHATANLAIAVVVFVRHDYTLW